MCPPSRLLLLHPFRPVFSFIFIDIRTSFVNSLLPYNYTTFVTNG